jgi:hypothetical protein
MKLGIFHLLFALSMLSATRTGAQIEGAITDSTDKAIAKAMIIATDSTNILADTVYSDDRGFYEFKKLKPGKYNISVKAAGFQKAVFEKITARARLREHSEYYDISNATRLDIILAKPK